MRLRGLGIKVTLLSGDRAATVQHVAQAVGIDDCATVTRRPRTSARSFDALQREGAIVAMVGDGINDAPRLAQADVSLTLGRLRRSTQWTADMVVLGDDLERVGAAFETARRTFRVIRQNLAWALGYNAVAIPLAASRIRLAACRESGHVASSLIVVGNALRLARPDDAHVQLGMPLELQPAS